MSSDKALTVREVEGSATRRPRVFVINDTGLKFDLAESFGDVLRLSVGSVDPFAPGKLQKHLTKQLADDFDEALDYLCPTGSALACGLVFAWCALHCDGPVKLLLFDAKTRTYFSRAVDL